MAGHNSGRNILIGLTAGAMLGIVARLIAAGNAWLPWLIEHLTLPIGQIFMRLLFMLVVPLLFSALVIGVQGLDVRHLGRLGVRMLVYTAVMSLIAVSIGISLVNGLQPGVGLPDTVRDSALTSASVTVPPNQADASDASFFVSMFPDNPVKAASNGDMIGVILFALFFGVALSFTRTSAARQLSEVIQGIYEVSMTLINGVLKLAPLGVGALIFTMTVRLGADIFVPLLAYVGVVLLGLGLHMFVVYPLSVFFLGKRSPLVFFKDIRLVMTTAFATASSSATLPTALKVAEEDLQLTPHISRFVLTAGSAMNQNGTALFEGVTVLFLAQVFGVHLAVSEQLTIMAICVLGGIGTAGVPAGSIPVIAMILVKYHIPVEGLALIMGVDRFLDMCRTTLNVTGDLVAAVYLTQSEADAGINGVRVD